MPDSGGVYLVPAFVGLGAPHWDPYARGAVLAGRLMAVNSIGISLTITTGIAPLLFVQVLYQQYFYTATILIAPVWMLFLLMLMVGYYATYLYKFKGTPARGSGGTGWLLVAAAMFLLIAMVHVAVHLIHSQPEKWAAKIVKHCGGNDMNWVA